MAHEEIISSKDGWERVYQLYGQNITHSTLIELLQLGVVSESEVRTALGFPNAEDKK